MLTQCVYFFPGHAYLVFKKHILVILTKCIHLFWSYLSNIFTFFCSYLPSAFTFFLILIKCIHLFWSYLSSVFTFSGHASQVYLGIFSGSTYEVYSPFSGYTCRVYSPFSCHTYQVYSPFCGYTYQVYSPFLVMLHRCIWGFFSGHTYEVYTPFSGQAYPIERQWLVLTEYKDNISRSLSEQAGTETVENDGETKSRSA